MMPEKRVTTWDPQLWRRGLILPVVLAVTGLLALLVTGFLYFLRAEVAGLDAATDAKQARLACESGLQEFLATIRIAQHDVAAWYDVPERFRHALVFSPEFDRESDPLRDMASRREYLESTPNPPPAWRYSIVAEIPDGPPGVMRFGTTPESGKLNINYASEAQITRLIEPLLIELNVENPQELIASLLDWLDPDDEPREGGAESDYYEGLDPPYDAKNGPLDSIEELLLVRGWTAALLYGEDVNRNGILDANEDDGDASFPYYDDADGVLDRGVAPYITVWSREPDLDNLGRPRINLRAGGGQIQEQLQEYFGDEIPLSEATINFLSGLNAQALGQARSIADLYTGAGLEQQPATSEPNAPAQPAPAAVQDSPITLAELPVVMDEFSVRANPDPRAMIAGLININTAPPRVLALIPNITDEAVTGIVAKRADLDPAELTTVAWPLTSGAVDLATFRQIAPYITTKAYQQHVEILGYADHRKLMRRMEWVVERIGPVTRILYHRDLTRLGPAWPIDEEQAVVQQ